MERDWLATGEAARRIGIHPNTLRWYESAGYLPPVPRTRNGFRTYTPWFVRLAKMVHACQPLLRIYGPVRRMGKTVLSLCRDNLTADALKTSRALEEHLNRELSLAHSALNVLEQWRTGMSPASGSEIRLTAMVYLGEAAARTGLTRDTILNWERNGLCSALRAPANGYRIYGKEDIERLLVIRSCRTSGYSITAIRRLLRVIDQGMTEALIAGSGPAHLETVANTPHPDEMALFPVFPTDTLPQTLENCIAIVQALHMDIQELADCSGPVCE
jgi:DNA-binding transcriptional MerR regulator